MNKRILALLIAVILAAGCTGALATTTDVKVTYTHTLDDSGFFYRAYLPEDISLVRTPDSNQATAAFNYGISNVGGIVPDGYYVELAFQYNGQLEINAANTEYIENQREKISYGIYSSADYTTKYQTNTEAPLATYGKEDLEILRNSNGSELRTAYILADVSPAHDPVDMEENTSYTGSITLVVKDSTSK